MPGIMSEGSTEACWLKSMHRESKRELEKWLRIGGRIDAAATAHRPWEQGGEKALEQ